MSELFEQWHETQPKWLTGDGPSADIVVATRARLARNLAGFRFPIHLDSDELETVYQELRVVLSESPGMASGHFLNLAETPEDHRNLLQEGHLASPPFLADPQGRGLMVAEGRSVVAQVNDEDHLQLVVLVSGFDPESAAARVLAIEGDLEKLARFAYRDDLGYLTANPTNVGTGLRLTALMHLPGLVLAEEIDKILNALQQLRFSVRGDFGKGSTVRGAVFQVSNLVTLGREEEEIVNDFSFHVGKVLMHEKSAREQLYAKDSLRMEDMAHRSLAQLQSARIITTQETFDLLSHVRLGASLGILPGITPQLLNKAMICHQISHLEKIHGSLRDGQAAAVARASFLRGLFREYSDQTRPDSG